MHGALQIGAVIALVADYLVWLDRTQIWVQNSLNKNGSNVADLYAALRRRMRTTAAGSHSTSPDQELHIYVGSVCQDLHRNEESPLCVKRKRSQLSCSAMEQPHSRGTA